MHFLVILLEPFRFTRSLCFWEAWMEDEAVRLFPLTFTEHPLCAGCRAETEALLGWTGGGTPGDTSILVPT